MILKQRLNVILACLFLLLALGCKQDKCKKVTCENDGVCSDGVCTCAEGYEGSDCSTLSRSRFLGDYQCTGNCNGVNSSYTASIEAGVTATEVKFINLGNMGVELVGYVHGASVEIPTQTVYPGVAISGAGHVYGSEFNVNYSLSGNSVATGCDATWLK